ncbi:MAG: hypothetical protein JNK85_21420 [Verrucomicrobiales bacterium]|nr:hypothetical protein [Verrucomicrobiales bacterium]
MPPACDSEPRSWRAWLSALGPGAIVASLTIGTGELVFSTRAGALFGYGILGWIGLVLLLKWALVLASAHYWVHADAHPLQSWSYLPGPRGWLPILLLLLAAPAFPIWVSFHAGTLGALAAAVTQTRDGFQGNAPVLWGLAILVGVLILAATGGYARQERFQAIVIAIMVISVVAALVMLQPNWADFLGGFFSLGPYTFPEWAMATPEFRDRPVWVEITTYAGVVGGSGYDYLAYVAWLRDKHGNASSRQMPLTTLRRMIRLDAVVSFTTVLIFSAVFVACGALILGPKQQIPAGSDLLTLQAQFVEVVGPWLRPLYFTGAFLAMIGTLYGTIEVAPAILREILHAVRGDPNLLRSPGLRRWAVGWCAGGAVLVMIGSWVWRLATGSGQPPNLIAWVTPANLFTGVLACGWISGLNLWSNHGRTPGSPALPWPLILLNLCGTVLFTIAGVKAVYDQQAWIGLGLFAVCLIAAWFLARRNQRQRG